MVPKLHAKGTSFKGAAAYLLHDKDKADTDERVSWTETRNIAVNDADLAWRVMAATAMDQGRLKAAAGVKNTGRKSAKHVMHMSLSWHPDQDPSREEMLSAADGALQALGADKHQALIIAHSDEKHPHLHVVINRVSPVDGRHLSSSKEKLNLSKWAQAYEERTGIYCENRRVNNAHRERGDYVRGKKDDARHIHEAQAGLSANDNDKLAAVRAAQSRKDHALAQRGRNMAKMHTAAWSKLESAYKGRQDALARDLSRQVEKAKAKILEDMRPAWSSLISRQTKEREVFESLEDSFFGRASNIVKTVRLSAKLLRQDKTGILKRSFGILTNAGDRKTYFEAAQERARKALEREQAAKVAEARAELSKAHKGKLSNARGVYMRERDDLSATQAAEAGRLKDDWKVRTAERTSALQEAVRLDRLKGDTTAAMRKATGPDPRSAKDNVLARAMRAAQDFEAAKRDRAREQDNKRDRGRDDEQER